MQVMSKAVGIDLGTTNSAVAIMNSTGTDVIIHCDAVAKSYTTPSCVWKDPKTGEIVVVNRGHASEIAIHGEKPFDNPYSANVVDICPVGALTSSDFRFKVRSWFLKGTSSVCGGCSTGCNLRIDHSARAMGGGIPGESANDGKIYRTVGRRNVVGDRRSDQLLVCGGHRAVDLRGVDSLVAMVVLGDLDGAAGERREAVVHAVAAFEQNG